MNKTFAIFILATIILGSLAPVIAYENNGQEYIDWRYVNQVDASSFTPLAGALDNLFKNLQSIAISSSRPYVQGQQIDITLSEQIKSEYNSLSLDVIYGSGLNSTTVYHQSYLICKFGDYHPAQVGPTGAMSAAWTCGDKPTHINKPAVGSTSTWKTVLGLDLAKHGSYTIRVDVWGTPSSGVGAYRTSIDVQSIYLYPETMESCSSLNSCTDWAQTYSGVEGTYEKRTCSFYSLGEFGRCYPVLSRPETRVSCSQGYTSNIQSTACEKGPCEANWWVPTVYQECGGVSFTQRNECGDTRTAVGQGSCANLCSDSGWTPSALTVCEGEEFEQTSNCLNKRTSVGTKVCTAECVDSQWLPSASEVCSSKTFTQTSNCMRQKTTLGAKDCAPVEVSNLCTDSSWSPHQNTVCSGNYFLQTSNCGTTRSAEGNKNCAPSCTESTWLPQEGGVCSGTKYEQTSNCGTTREATGVMSCQPSCVDASWTPEPSTVCYGLGFTQTSNCNQQRSSYGTKDCAPANTCTDTSWSPGTDTVCGGQSFTQSSNCGTWRTMIGTKNCQAGCTISDWSPSPATVCAGDTFWQKSNCGNMRQSTGTKECTQVCTDSTWTPATSTECSGTTFSQTSNCGTTRSAVGVKSGCALPQSCTESSWSPEPSTVCSGDVFSQNSNCGTQRSGTGTKTCSQTQSCIVDSWSPGENTVCSSQSFTQTNNCGGTRASTGSKTCESGSSGTGGSGGGSNCNMYSWTPSPSDYCSSVKITQVNGCGSTRTADGTKVCTANADKSTATTTTKVTLSQMAGQLAIIVILAYVAYGIFTSDWKLKKPVSKVKKLFKW